MAGLAQLLEHLSHKLEIGVNDTKVSRLDFLIRSGQSLTLFFLLPDTRHRSLEHLETSKDHQQSSL